MEITIIVLSIATIAMLIALFAVVKELRSAKNEQIKLMSENTQLSASTNASKNEIETLEAENRNIKDTIESLRDNNTSLQSEKSALNATLVATKEQLEKSNSANAELSEQLHNMQQLNTDLKSENVQLKERVKIVSDEIVNIRKESETHFKSIAQDILEDKSRKFKETNEARISEILNPLKENIESFKKEINDKYINENNERNKLQEHIKNLIELNNTIGKEAKELTQALRGNTKVQGDWGEMILQTILEKSGLIEGENYKTQVTRDENGELLKDENGNKLRPDVVLYMPDSRKLVIDSKVSLTNYINFVNADSIEEQQKHLKLHINSIRNHINELSQKKYQDYIGQSGNFVLMFIPNEGAYISAMQADQNLWHDAFDNRVTIISPTHLISTLKLIHELWQHDKQTKNALQIATESGKLYDKFVGFVDDLSKIGKSIDNTQVAYTSAMKKLQDGTGNLISRVENLKKMGAKASKSLPQITEE